MRSDKPIDPKKIPKDLGERNAWVIAQLKARGLSLAAIARENDWCSRTPSMALRLPNYPAEMAIAAALGTTPEILFFERYDRSGRRLHYVRSVNNSDQLPTRNSHVSEETHK